MCLMVNRLLFLSASPVTSMMQEVLMDKMCGNDDDMLSEQHEAPLQADLPDVLIPEPTGGLSHVCGLVEELPFHVVERS